MGIAVALWRLARPVRLAALQAAGQHAQQKIESGEWEMGIRDWKLNALTSAQRKERRQAGDAWWQIGDKAAREERQAGRKEKRQAGEAWWQIFGDASQPAAPVIIGSGLPGPGAPGSRTTGPGRGSGGVYGGGGNGTTGNGAEAPWYMNPLFLAVAAGGAWYLFGKKK